MIYLKTWALIFKKNNNEKIKYDKKKGTNPHHPTHRHKKSKISSVRVKSIHDYSLLTIEIFLLCMIVLIKI